MLDQKRKDIYKKLSPKTRDFVDEYLERVLGLTKFLDQSNETSEKLVSREKKEGSRIGNIDKLIDKKDYINKLSGNLDSEEYFKDFNPDFLEFLFPEFENTLHNPFLMKDMQKAVEKIVQAILNEEKICVYGDYDCDGVPGIALLRDFFEAIKYEQVIYYIPDRHKEGYGLNEKAIKNIAEQNVTLLITIDLGITNIKEVAYASSLNIDVIITDHHLPIISQDGENLPKAFAIINNKQASCSYPDKNLCGSGTVWKLVEALMLYNEDQKLWQIGKGLSKWMLDLVGIATIADMVPLSGENRTLAIYGMHVLKNTKREGLKTLLKNAKIDMNAFSEDDVAFSIAPRVNAASRMDHPVWALNMFSNNMKLGIDSAHHLELLNQARKENVASIMRKVHKTIEERQMLGALSKVLVIGDSEWAPGVLGLIASGITEKYHVTSFVWGKGEDENVFKGSCRGAGDIHVSKLMTECAKQFTQFGGHEEAGGFAIHFNKIHELEKNLNDKKILQKCELVKHEKVGGVNIFEIDLEDVTSEFLTGLNLIGPFGVGNAKPIFKIRNLDRFEIMRFGKKGEHVKIILYSRTTKREAVKFFVDHIKQQELADSIRELTYSIEPGFRNSPARLKII